MGMEGEGDLIKFSFFPHTRALWGTPRCRTVSSTFSAAVAGAGACFWWSKPSLSKIEFGTAAEVTVEWCEEGAAPA